MRTSGGTCFDPEETEASLFVRNDVDFYDCRLNADVTTILPSWSSWHTYLYVFKGAVDIGEASIGYTALMTDDCDVSVTAVEGSTIIAFIINPDAPVMWQDTISR